MVGPAMAVAIGYALHAPAMVLFSLIPVGYATNVMGGAGGPLAVYVVAIVAAEFGKMVSKETKIDILVTPIVTILIGIGAAYFIAAPIGKGAMAVRYPRPQFAQLSASRVLQAARLSQAAVRTWSALRSFRSGKTAGAA